MDIHFRERENSVPLWMTVTPAMRRQIEDTIERLTGLLDQIDGGANGREPYGPAGSSHIENSRI